MMASLNGFGRFRSYIPTILALVLCGIVASNSQAQITNLSNGGSINYSALNGTNLSVQIGDKLFSNFGFSYVDTDGNSGDDLLASALVLSSLSNQIGFGVSLQLPLVATGTVIKDITIKFSATVLDPNQKISDMHLNFTGSASGNGISEVSESVFTNGFGSGNIANLSLTENSAGFVPPSGEVSAVFSNAQSMIWIQKDIFVSGNPNALPDGNPPSDFASITIVNQTFSQVPEPSTIVLSLAGIVAFLSVRRRK
jgi:hypothetical protein